MNTLAYDAGRPCLNPNCKSHGLPHPNCRCYSEPLHKAEGGDVGHFCSESRSHNPECEYYKEGGEVEDSSPISILSGIGRLGALIQSGLLKGHNEISNSLIHDDAGDPISSVASALAHEGAGNILGAFPEKESYAALRSAEDQKLKNRSQAFLSKIGDSLDPEDFSSDKLKSSVQKILNRKIGEEEHAHVTPAMLKVLSSGNTENMSDAIDHARSIYRGSKAIDDSLDDLFDEDKDSDPEKEDMDHEKIMDHVENGMQDKQIESDLTNKISSFASGGQVGQPVMDSFLGGFDAVATHWPKHASLLGEAKSRVYNYLNSLRPVISKQLPFDHNPDVSSKKKSYEDAARIAHAPLSVVNKMKKGVLTLENLIHFRTMYPEIYNELSKRMTKKISQDQMGDKRPSYGLRKSMSMFLGAPLDSTFTSQNIIAAQPKPIQPMQQAQPQGPKGKSKGSMNKLDKLNTMYQTPDQKREQRQGSAV